MTRQIHRRRFLAWTTKLTAGAASAALLAATRARADANDPARRPPNIVFVFIDDMGYADPSCFGNPKIKTPAIDKLASEGRKLTNFYVNSPICSPSRVAVTTGQDPARWKVLGHFASRAQNKSRSMPDWLDAKAPTTARILKQAGYATAHFGKWHLGGGRDVGDAPLPKEYGFDESLVSFEGLGDRILPPGGLSNASAKLGRGKITRAPKHEMTRRYVDRAIDFLRRNKDRPFYLRLFPNDVHDAHQPAAGEEGKWAKVTDNPYERKFFAVLAEMDRQLGRLFDEVDRLGLAERTLIVFTSDNGPTDWPTYYRQGWQPPGFTGRFTGRKWSLYEGGIRMPFIARWKGRIPPGTADEETIACGIDLPVTFCGLAGASAAEGVRLDGEDISSALLGKPRSRRRPIFWQYGGRYTNIVPGNPKFVSPELAVREGDWKLLLRADGSGAELYNLREDPGELHDLSRGRQEQVKDLSDKIRAWCQDVGLPVPPRGAR